MRSRNNDTMSNRLIITGGSRGIGAETARRAAARGDEVVVVYGSRADGAEALVDGIRHDGGRAMAVRADVAVEADVTALFERVDRELGPITGLVNSAGIAGDSGRVDQYDAHGLERLFAVNVIGTMLCCREGVRRMSTRHGGQGGAIVNVSSMASTIGGRAGSAHYAASKAAVDSFTKGLAKEVASEKVRVNAVRPGMVATDMIGPLLADRERANHMAKTIAMNRFAEPGEIAAAILWLLSDEAPFVSGTLLDASGGGFVI